MTRIALRNQVLVGSRAHVFEVRGQIVALGRNLDGFGVAASPLIAALDAEVDCPAVGKIAHRIRDALAGRAGCSCSSSS